MSSSRSRLGLVVALTSVLAAPAACGGEEFTSDDAAGTAGPGGDGSGASGGGNATGTAASAGGAGGMGTSAGTCASSDEVCIDVPDAWSGPVVLLLDVGEPPACGGNWPIEDRATVQGPAVGEHSCSACECAAPTGGDCQSPAYTTYSNQSCTTKKDDGDAGSGCYQIPNSGGSGLIAQAALATPGDCLATGGDPIVAAPEWTARGRACAGATAGDACGGGTCYPAPEGDARICVYRSGEHNCPNSWSNQHVLYEDWDDERSCTACTCGEESGAVCPGTLYGYSVTACDASNPSASSVTLAQDGLCKFIPGNQIKQLYWLPGARVAGTCPAGSSEPEGEVMPVDPITYCCRGG
ncbi:MAG: hypothetical protein WKG00_28340 [Polyangiaceae bacterium]